MMIEVIRALRRLEAVRMLRASSIGRIAAPILHAGNLFLGGLASAVLQRGCEVVTCVGEPVRLDPNYVLNHYHLPDSDPMLAAFLKALGPGQIVYDVGSYIGIWAILAARVVGTAGRVVAFEPAPASVRLVRRHIRLNEVAEIVTVVEAAIGDASGASEFYEACLSPENSLLTKTGSLWHAVSVPMLTLDEYASQTGLYPDVVKVDVEGAELQVLKGAQHLLTQRRPMVFCELHRFAWQAFGFSEGHFWQALVDFGYEALNPVTMQPLKVIPEHGYAVLCPGGDQS